MEPVGEIFHQELNNKMKFSVTVAIGKGRQWCVIHMANNLFHCYEFYARENENAPPLHTHTHKTANTQSPELTELQSH
jgi:hypothetical protein